MASTAELTAGSPALAAQADVLARPASTARRMANAVRALVADVAETARDRQPGISMAMADAGAMLWTRFLKFDAADPHWPDRDRCVLSGGHGSMVLCALLHLTGHAGVGVDELRRFRQMSARTAGVPAFGGHAAIEASGPLGQGLAMAVGMALAERMMAARFGKSLVDHRTWAIVGDGDLMEGISHEAIGLAGDLRLEKLTVLYADTAAPADRDTASACPADQLRRFAAHGWSVKAVDGRDAAQVAAALSFAMRAKKPTLIACRTGVSPGAPRGAAGARTGQPALGWSDLPFNVPDDVAECWLEAGARGAGARRAWLKREARHPLRTEFERVVSGRLPEAWHEAIAALKAEIAERRPELATCRASGRALELLLPAVPELAGGSAAAAGSTLASGRSMGAISSGSYGGRHLDFGFRAHGMAACLNGMALHGGVIPFGGTFLEFTDHMRPALRLAALMRRRVIHVLADDGIGLGDGPAHQPIEHLASLRAMPNLHVFRPADAMETAECWELALRRAEGPSLLVLGGQAGPSLRADMAENRCSRGGYVLAEAEGARRATLIATGSEVSIAMAARSVLSAEGLATAVVSLPCWELFAAQDEAYRAQVLGGVPRIGVEAACGFGWERWLGGNGLFVGMTSFGASGPSNELYRHFGITADTVATAVRKRLG